MCFICLYMLWTSFRRCGVTELWVGWQVYCAYRAVYRNLQRLTMRLWLCPPAAARNSMWKCYQLRYRRAIFFFSGATALQGLGRQSGRRRSAKLVPTFADRGVSRGQYNGSPRPLISVYRTWIATYFIQVALQLTSRGFEHPVPDPLPLRKSGSARNRTRDLCICSQKPWPLDHIGGKTCYYMDIKL